jgi:hypothetical protein
MRSFLQDQSIPPMKILMLCFAFLAFASAEAQTVDKASREDLLYGRFTFTTGVYPLIGISSYPVAKFKYAYGSDESRTPIQYADSARINSSTSATGINVGAEFGFKNGVFFNTAMGGLLGMKSSQYDRTNYFTTGIGYNLRTPIRGLFLQSSVSWAKTLVMTELSDIPHNKSDILVFNETMRYKPSCGCISKSTNVEVHNSASFAQFKLGLKYNINKYIAFTAGVTYYAPLGSSMKVRVSNRADDFTRRGYAYSSSSAVQNDAIRNAALPLYAEASLQFRFKERPRSSSSSYHHHYSSGGHFYGGGHCH